MALLSLSPYTWKQAELAYLCMITCSWPADLWICDQHLCDFSSNIHCSWKAPVDFALSSQEKLFDLAVSPISHDFFSLHELCAAGRRWLVAISSLQVSHSSSLMHYSVTSLSSHTGIPLPLNAEYWRGSFRPPMPGLCLTYRTARRNKVECWNSSERVYAGVSKTIKTSAVTGLTHCWH